jgi:hypothetical protein
LMIDMAVRGPPTLAMSASFSSLERFVRGLGKLPERFNKDSVILSAISDAPPEN